MIADSVPWHEDLLRITDQLERRGGQRRWTERTSYLEKRDLMVGGYVVRRLSEFAGSRTSSTIIHSFVWMLGRS